jgi:hypothetical protein
MQITVTHLLHNHFRKSVGILSTVAHKLECFTKWFSARTTFELATVKVQEYGALTDA